MPRLSQQQTIERDTRIARVESLAKKKGITLSSPGDYKRQLFTIMQEDGTIPADVTYAQACERHDPAYRGELKQIEDFIRNSTSKTAKPKQPRTIRYAKFDIRVGSKATSASIHPVMTTMLALHLDQKPGTPSARRAVAKWLQHAVDEHNDPGRSAVSRWLQGVVLEELVSGELRKKYDAWILSDS